jgi:hypothetical protein
LLVRRYSPKQIQSEWAVIEGYIADALTKSECDEYDVEDVRSSLINEHLHLFVGVEQDKIQGVIVISFVQYPKQKVAFICAYGGKFVTNKEAYKQLCLLFKAFGATKVQGYVRNSVARLTKRLGFVEKQILVEHKL